MHRLTRAVPDGRRGGRLVAGGEVFVGDPADAGWPGRRRPSG